MQTYNAINAIVVTNNPTGDTTYLNTAFATFSMIYPNPAGLSRDEYLAQVVPTNVLLADIKANYTNWISSLVNNISEEDMIAMLSKYYPECDFEDCVWTAIDNGTLAFDSTYTMNYARDYYWTYLMEKLYQSNSDTFTYNAAYTRPKVIADLFETWRLPLSTFMDEVETHFDQATREAIDIDTIQKVQHLWVNEWNMYGSSRLGIFEAQKDTIRGVIRSYDHRVSNDTVSTAYFAIDTLQYNKFNSDSIHYLHKGRKRYEGTNHLGNVLVAYTDKRLQVCTNDTIHYYRADVVNAYEYSPFGALMPDRKWDSDTTLKYRFGFNGQERDDEVSGNGNSYSFKYRIHDARLGRFLSVDPLSSTYPFWSPYAFAGNTPIMAKDLEGLEIKTVVHHLSQGIDGSLIIIKTETSIEKDLHIVDETGHKKALTSVVFVMEGVIVGDEVLLEDVKTPKGMVPSAAYDYTQNVINGKISDDFSYYFYGGSTWPARIKNIISRDLKAPDNARTIQDLEVLEVALETILKKSLGGRKFSKANAKDLLKNFIIDNPNNWRSVKKFGHTFSRHGSQKAKNLLGRAKGTKSNQGYWTNNDKAANALSKHSQKGGTKTIDIEDGLGKVIKPDGTTVSAKKATIVFNTDGTIKTAFPILTD